MMSPSSRRRSPCMARVTELGMCDRVARIESNGLSSAAIACRVDGHSMVTPSHCPQEFLASISKYSRVVRSSWSVDQWRVRPLMDSMVCRSGPGRIRSWLSGRDEAGKGERIEFGGRGFRC
jgi:hypothetical protein